MSIMTDFISFISFAKILRINEPAEFTNTDIFRTIILINFPVSAKSSIFALASLCKVRLRLGKRRAEYGVAQLGNDFRPRMEEILREKEC